MSYSTLDQLNQYQGNSPWCYSVQRANSFNSDKPLSKNLEIRDSPRELSTSTKDCSKYSSKCNYCGFEAECGSAFAKQFAPTCVSTLKDISDASSLEHGLPAKSQSGNTMDLDGDPCCYVTDLFCANRDENWKATFGEWVTYNVNAGSKVFGENCPLFCC